MSMSYTGPYKKGEIKKVVLAYSGGLDTSVILKWLQTTYGCEVVTFTADLGQGEELAPARKKAEMAGVKPENIFIDDVREEFVRDFVFPMFRANALYEGQYLLGTSIARPLIAKRQIEIAQRDRRRRRRARRHRQGQRPGPLRAHLLCAQARHQGDRAVARMGADLAHQAARVRREAPDPDRQGQARRGAVLGRRQPPALLERGQDPGGSLAGGRRDASTSARSRPRPRPTRRPISRSISRRAMRSRSTAEDVAGDAAHQAQRARQGQRHRPARPGREPLRRHEEPRHLRDAGRHDPARRPSRHRIDHARPRRGAPQGRADAASTPSWSTSASGTRPSARCCRR